MNSDPITERLRALRHTGELPAPDDLLGRAFPDLPQRSDAPSRPLPLPALLTVGALAALALGPLWLQPGPRDRVWREGLVQSLENVLTQIGKWNPQ